MKKLLFIYSHDLKGAFGGARRTKNAFDGLSKFFPLIPYYTGKKKNKLKTLFRYIFLYSAGLSKHDCKEIINIVKNNDLAGVYFDTSAHGRLIKKIKKQFPLLKVIVNYHNFEKQYCYDMLLDEGITRWPIYRAVSWNEKEAIKYADLNVFITEEDRDNIEKEYGIKSNNVVIPPLLDDYFAENKQYNNILGQPYVLFLGNASYANIEGAEYLINKIVPFLKTECLIVGSGMKSALSKYEERKNLHIMDYVEDLSQVMSSAYLFVSPLFSGSGAKIKVAEALMFGKKIIGTPLSFLGYDVKNLSSIELCNNSKEFIDVINNSDIDKTYYNESRELFIKKYSDVNLDTYYSKIKDYIEN